MTAKAVVKFRRGLADITRDLCEIPPDQSVTDWAEQWVTLPEQDHAPYRADGAPYQRRWLDATADPTVSKIVLCWAAQTGKSTAIEIGLAHRIHRRPSYMLVLQPDIPSAERWAKVRFRPRVRSIPPLKSRISLSLGGGNTLRMYQFPGGSLEIIAAQSPGELAQRTADILAPDEIDLYEAVPGEGDVLDLARKRLASRDITLEIYTSTPRDAETTKIMPLLEGGTNERYQVPCPHCGHYQELVWGGVGMDHGVKWPADEPQKAYYLCVACAAVIEESHKRPMLLAGRWVATNPDAPYLSSHLNALYSQASRSSWGHLASEFVAAKGKAASLQVFVNTRLAELWKEKLDAMDSAQLVERLEEMEEGVVPAGVGLVTAGVDIQENRIEVYTWGWGHGLESWLLSSEVFMGDTAAEPSLATSPFRALFKYLNTLLRHANGKPVPIFATMIDSGFRPTQVFQAVRRVNHVFASKGFDGTARPILGKPSMTKTGSKLKVPLFPVGVDQGKTQFLRSQLQEQTPGPGFVHLPNWLTVDQCEQLVAEKRVPVMRKGVTVFEWRRKRDDMPNEALDCRIYARAALERAGAPTIGKLGELAEQLAAPATTPTVETPLSQVQVPSSVLRPPRSGWARNW